MAGKLQVVIVTPERTMLDESADFVALPMVDGEAGFLPAHAPMIGRLGAGEMRVRNDGSESRFFISGGFAQIENGTLSVLPGESFPADTMTAEKANKALADAEALPGDQPALHESRQQAINVAKAKQRFAGA